MRLISVDGGTTNTRLVLISDGAVIASGKLKFGLRDRLDNEGPSYRDALSGGIKELLSANGLEEKDIDAVVVSGMICSEHGLYEVPHIPAPVDPASLAASMKQMRFPEIANIPFYLVPGVKTSADMTDPSTADIMRGEETELCGITGRMQLSEGVTLVLPGSHCKIIPVDASSTIRGFSTTVSGELIRAAAEHTILRDGIRDAYPHELSGERLLEGFDLARALGLTSALFKVRILQKFKGYSPDELFAVLCGAILSEDIRAIEAAGNRDVLVGGSDPFRSAIVLLTNNRTALKAGTVPAETAENAVAYGAERLLKIRN